MKEGRKYLEQHLPQVAAGQEWLSLDGCKVAEILSSDRLQCREEEVWMAAVKWAENQEKLDNKEWLAILKEVRLDLIKLDFYEKNVKPHPLMEKTEESETTSEMQEPLSLDRDTESPPEARHRLPLVVAPRESTSSLRRPLPTRPVVSKSPILLTTMV